MIINLKIRKLSKIIILSTFKEIGKEMFYYCGSCLANVANNFTNLIDDIMLNKKIFND